MPETDTTTTTPKREDHQRRRDRDDGLERRDAGPRSSIRRGAGSRGLPGGMNRHGEHPDTRCCPEPSGFDQRNRIVNLRRGKVWPP